MLGGALEALSGEVLIRRSLEVSSTSFITIISIILGVALAVLVEKTFPSPSPLAGVQSACMFLLITSLEIPAAYALGHVAGWDVWLAVVFLFGGAGIGSTVKWVPISHFGGDEHARRMVHRLLRELSVILIAGAFGTGALGLVAHFVPAGQMWWGFGSCGAVTATLGTVVARMELRLSQIHAYYGVNRPPFN